MGRPFSPSCWHEHPQWGARKGGGEALRASSPPLRLCSLSGPAVVFRFLPAVCFSLLISVPLSLMAVPFSPGFFQFQTRKAKNLATFGSPSRQRTRSSGHTPPGQLLTHPPGSAEPAGGFGLLASVRWRRSNTTLAAAVPATPLSPSRRRRRDSAGQHRYAAAYRRCGGSPLVLSVVRFSL